MSGTTVYVAIGYADGDHEVLGVFQTAEAAKGVCSSRRHAFYSYLVEAWEVGNVTRVGYEYGRSNQYFGVEADWKLEWHVVDDEAEA